MLIAGSAAGVVENIGAGMFSLLLAIVFLKLAWEASPRQQRQTLQRGDLPGASPVWVAVAFRLFFLLLGLVFLAIDVLAIAGVIPIDTKFQW